MPTAPHCPTRGNQAFPEGARNHPATGTLAKGRGLRPLDLIMELREALNPHTD
jgi:hypothetical protein